MTVLFFSASDLDLLASALLELSRIRIHIENGDPHCKIEMTPKLLRKKRQRCLLKEALFL